MAFTYEQILQNIRNKVFHPIYFLMGEEPYFIDTITDLLEETVLEEAEKAFNLLVMYGRDVDVHTIISQARIYPMLGNYQLVIVKEAQDVKDIELIESAMVNFPPTTILVINYKYKKLDGRKSFSKTIDKKGVLFESKKLYDNKIPEWIRKYLQQRQYNISPKAEQMLTDYLGTDLHKIRNELEKLMISLKPGSKITDVEVEEKIGISKDFNIFELQNAIGSKNILKANQIINYFGDNSKETPVVFTVVMLYQFFSKMLKYHFTPDKSASNLTGVLGVIPFFQESFRIAARNYSVADIAKIISILREYDMKAKGYGSNDLSDAELYKELLYKIIHVRQA